MLRLGFLKRVVCINIANIGTDQLSKSDVMINKIKA